MSSTQSVNLGFTSPASASTAVGTVANGGLVAGLDQLPYAIVHALLQGATGGALDVYLQSSVNGGANWYDVCHFPQLAAAAAPIRYLVALTRGFIGTPAITAPNTADGTPTLTVNTSVPYSLGNALRVVMVAGAATSAGAVQSVFCLIASENT